MQRHHTRTGFERPHWTRRRFFQLTGAGVCGAFLAQRYAGAAPAASSGGVPKNTARNVVFILLAGGPSQVDTFDFKMTDGVTPTAFAPESINGVLWPTGIMPMLADRLPNIAIVRSMRAHALVHSLAQTWVQIGRNPVSGTGGIAPHIGSVVAIEKDPERKDGEKFPTFLALNSDAADGSGYLAAKYGPFKIVGNRAGLANASHPAGEARFQRRLSLMRALDDQLGAAPAAIDDYRDFYTAAQGLTYDAAVDQAFTFAAGDSARYGSSSLGDACLTAYQVLAAQQGTRFVQITSNDGWDMHQSIYASGPTGLPSRAAVLDLALSALLDDLKSSGLFADTMVVMLGEFGRTVGPLTTSQGRDHYAQQFAVFAGGGVKGGTVIGATNASGSDVTEFGWSRNRYVYVEDIEATIYSAMGIDWTYVRTDDPLHRGFEYTPFSEEDLYGPVHELWG